MESSKLYGVYTWVNKINNKVYVGSSSNLTERFNAHFSGSNSNKHLQKDIELYGINNFAFSILEFIDIDLKKISVEEARKILLEREQYYLDELCKADDPSNLFYKNSYNRNRKAESSLGSKWSEESKKKKSEAQTGRKLTEKWIENISKGHKSKKEGYIHFSKKRGLTNRELSHLEKMSKNQQIPVLQYDLEGNFIKEWESLTLAAKCLNIHASNISKCTTGKLSYTSGFVWIKKVSNIIENKINVNLPPLIYAYNENFELLGKFKDAASVSKKLNISSSCVIEAIRENKFSKNYYFEYGQKKV